MYKKLQEKKKNAVSSTSQGGTFSAKKMAEQVEKKKEEKKNESKLFSQYQKQKNEPRKTWVDNPEEIFSGSKEEIPIKAGKEEVEEIKSNPIVLEPEEKKEETPEGWEEELMGNIPAHQNEIAIQDVMKKKNYDRNRAINFLKTQEKHESGRVEELNEPINVNNPPIPKIKKEEIKLTPEEEQEAYQKAVDKSERDAQDYIKTNPHSTLAYQLKSPDYRKEYVKVGADLDKKYFINEKLKEKKEQLKLSQLTPEERAYEVRNKEINEIKNKNKQIENQIGQKVDLIQSFENQLNGSIGPFGYTPPNTQNAPFLTNSIRQSANEINQLRANLLPIPSSLKNPKINEEEILNNYKEKLNALGPQERQNYINSMPEKESEKIANALHMESARPPILQGGKWHYYNPQTGGYNEYESNPVQHYGLPHNFIQSFYSKGTEPHAMQEFINSFPTQEQASQRKQASQEEAKQNQYWKEFNESAAKVAQNVPQGPYKLKPDVQERINKMQESNLINSLYGMASNNAAINQLKEEVIPHYESMESAIPAEIPAEPTVFRRPPEQFNYQEAQVPQRQEQQLLQRIRGLMQPSYNLYENARERGISPYALHSILEQQRQPQQRPQKKRRDIIGNILGYFNPNQFNPDYYPEE